MPTEPSVPADGADPISNIRSSFWFMGWNERYGLGIYESKIVDISIAELEGKPFFISGVLDLDIPLTNQWIYRAAIARRGSCRNPASKQERFRRSGKWVPS